MTAPPEWLPHPIDLQAAIATLVARVKSAKRPAALLMRMAGEDGRLYALADALMWLLWRQYRLDEVSDAIDQLEKDLLKLAQMIAEEEDNTDD